MSDNFLICIRAVVPLFLLLLVGYTVRRRGLTDDEITAKINSLAFKVLFPFLMFNNIYKADITEVINLKLIIFSVACIFAVYFISTFFVIKSEKNSKTRGAMIQAIFRSNFVIMGMPVASNIYGHGNVGVTAVMIAIVIPLFNILAVITLEIYRNSKVSISGILINILKNPLIEGAVVGVIASLAGLKLPGVFEAAISDLSGCATPIALLVLGASFKFSDVRNVWKNLTICCLLRLVAVPGVVLTLAYHMGFGGISFVTLVGIFAAPCAVSSFTMAQQMDSDYELAGATVIFTSVFACVTMFLWLFLFKSMGVF